MSFLTVLTTFTPTSTESFLLSGISVIILQCKSENFFSLLTTLPVCSYWKHVLCYKPCTIGTPAAHVNSSSTSLSLSDSYLLILEHALLVPALQPFHLVPSASSSLTLGPFMTSFSSLKSLLGRTLSWRDLSWQLPHPGHSLSNTFFYFLFGAYWNEIFFCLVFVSVSFLESMPY